MTDLATLRSACSQTGIEVVASLAQHRILSAAQVQAIHLPDGSYRWTQKVLSRLGEAAGYIETPHGAPRRLWHVTERGARLAREAGVLDGEPRLIGAEDAAGALQAHTLAVNDSAICFSPPRASGATISVPTPGARRFPTRSTTGAAGRLILLLYFVEQICSRSWSMALRSQAGRGRRVRGRQGKRRPSDDRRATTPVDDLKARMSIEQAQPGSALDGQLRREQAKAIFDLLIVYRRRHPD